MARPGMISKRRYEDFEPFCRWERSPDHDILHVHLQGFKRQQLKIQMSSAGVMTVTGERCLDCEHNRWARFSKETRVPANENIKTGEIHAKLSAGILSIVMSKKPQLVPPPPSSSSPDFVPAETEHPYPRHHEEQSRPRDEVVDDRESEDRAQRKDLVTTRRLRLRDLGRVANVVGVVMVVAVMLAVGAVLAWYGFRLSSAHGMGEL